MDKRPIGRPPGYRTTPEERERIAVAARAAWAMRRPWNEAVRLMREAIRNNDGELAHDILDAYMNTEMEAAA